jgi:uncharacterized membrane protein
MVMMLHDYLVVVSFLSMVQVKQNGKHHVQTRQEHAGNSQYRCYSLDFIRFPVFAIVVVFPIFDLSEQ